LNDVAIEVTSEPKTEEVTLGGPIGKPLEPDQSAHLVCALLKNANNKNPTKIVCFNDLEKKLLFI
jgi:hypothetical protein